MPECTNIRELIEDAYALSHLRLTSGSRKLVPMVSNGWRQESYVNVVGGKNRDAYALAVKMHGQDAMVFAQVPAMLRMLRTLAEVLAEKEGISLAGSHDDEERLHRSYSIDELENE